MVLTLNTDKFKKLDDKTILEMLKSSVWNSKYLLANTIKEIERLYSRQVEHAKGVGVFEYNAKWEKEVLDLYKQGLDLVACELLDKDVVNLWEKSHDSCGEIQPKNYIKERLATFPCFVAGKPMHTLNLTRIFSEYFVVLEKNRKNPGFRDYWMKEVMGDPQRFSSGDDISHVNNFLYYAGRWLPENVSEDLVKEFCVFLKDALPKQFSETIDKVEQFSVDHNYYIQLKNNYGNILSDHFSKS